MSRLPVWLAFLFGLAAVAGSPDAWGLARSSAQPPNQKADPKNPAPPAKGADPKAGAKAPATQPAPKQPEPKTPPPKGAGTTPPPKVDPKNPSPSPEPDPGLDGPPSPLDLVRGLREHGQSDLALEYLADIEKSPKGAAIKAEIPLERAKCLLEAADDEGDDGARLNLVGQAKDAFNAFLRASPNHPQASEAYLALAKLTALEAKAQLSQARKIDVPAEPGAEQDEAKSQQRDEAAKARPLFEQAAKQFQQAAAEIDKKLQAPGTDPKTRRALTQAKYDATLASGVNLMNIADTFMHVAAAGKTERDDRLDKARDVFRGLAADPTTPANIAGVARAWTAECQYERAFIKEAQEEFARILAAATPDMEDAKRTVRFFQLSRKSVSRDLNELRALEKEARAWLVQYSNVRTAQAEAVAVRYYLANAMTADANAQAPPGKPPAGLALTKLREAEKIYRQIGQGDSEYAARAGKRRLAVVRRLLGEADKPATDYKTFEECQMASLIQTSKLLEDEKKPASAEELKKRKLAIVELLERARELATDKDNPADVNEVLLRLVHYYQAADQPYRAAVLGEYVARNVRAGGKSSVAGVYGLTAYTAASGQLKITDANELDAARRADRDRAIRLARFLDTKFPNDAATDLARHRLAGILYEDRQPVEAYETLLKVRPGYGAIGTVRLFEGEITSRLLTAKDSPLPDARKPEIFRRTLSDLEKLPKPPADAGEDDVRTYLTARARLAHLYLLQPRIEPAREKADPGYQKALRIAEDAIDQVPTFKALVQGGGKTQNLDGWDLSLVAQDVRTRAMFLEGQTKFLEGRYDEAFAAVAKALAEMNDSGLTLAAVTKKMPIKQGEEEHKERVEKIAQSVDRLRQELIILALKVRVRQGDADKGAQLFDLLKKFGGSVESNVPTLQQMTGEMAGQILSLRRAGKADEAKVLTDGFAKLLDKVSAEPQLPPTVHLFLGQALIVVGEYGKAEESLKKIPAPDAAALAQPLASVTDDAQRQKIALYRRAALELVRALRQGKKYDDAAKLLGEAVGTKDKQGWAFNSLDFRKEFAYLAEARGSAESNPQAASKHWGEAVNEWTSQVTVTRNRVTSPDQPKGANGEVDNAAVQRNKNAFFDAFFEHYRCIVKANMQLRKGSPKLQGTFDDVGKKFAEIEKTGGPDMFTDTKRQYAELLDEIPELKKAYEAAGGKMFLEKPAPDAGM